ncbi:hypothetical protein JKF63_07761 [Porcisia hertigi]|uniref:Uncharacterized protein n=1 Tax=Porcisia hertigi TaxID=2761500 RepID=A0A837A9I9_9TRYP|nr:hypothetical protein JKF63_07761 [Porcisia hertigi]
MGFVDRGGGREAKGSSLRRSKKNPGAPTTKNKSANKNYTTPTTRATTTPPPACVPILDALIASIATAVEGDKEEFVAKAASTVTGCEKALAVARDAAQGGRLPHIDSAVALLSRKLEDDQEGIFRRAVEEGHLAAMVCWCGEVERQSLLLDTCVQHNKLYQGALAQQHSATDGGVRHVRFMDDNASPSGAVVTSITTAATASASSSAKSGVVLYAVLGIHVNNIDRLNMRLHDQWIKELETNVKHGDVVGVLTGINLSRDRGTHYAQERLFKECWRVAAQVHLPLVLHLHAADAATLTETVNRAAELLIELLSVISTATDDGSAAPSAVVLYNGLRPLHASTAMQQLVRAHRPGARGTAATVPFYVLATADGLVTTKSECEEGEATGQAESKPSIDALAALLPPRVDLSSDPASATATGSEGDAAVHLSQLLIGTGAPWGTPQNLPDPHLCTLPNEPGNYAYVLQTLYDTMRVPVTLTRPALTLADLSAIAVLNHVSVFFHEYISVHRQQQQQHSSGDNEAMTDAEQQRQWAESQQPAAPTAVAGVADDDTRRDLEALLAEAARERERVEQERLLQEAARERARNEELQEKRSKRDRKKNVKANNRSNFTHFRNKDFAPRHDRQEKSAHLRERSIRAGSGTDAAGGDAHREGSPASSSSETSDSDAGAAGANSLAAEVEELLRANAAHCDAERVAQHQQHRSPGRGKGKRKGKGKADDQ